MKSGAESSAEGDQRSTKSGHHGSSVSFQSRLYWAVRFILVFLDITLCIATHCVFMLLLRPILFYSNKMHWYWRLEAVLFRMISCHVAGWYATTSNRLCLHGDDVSPRYFDQRILVLCNHVSTADVPSLMYLWHGWISPMDYLFWIMDDLFKWSPFGLVSQVHQDFFIRQGRETRHLQPIKLAQHVCEKYLPLKRQWIVVFPEGGFHYKRVKSSQDFAEKNNLRKLEHVTYPRIGALYAIVRALQQEDAHIDYVLDLTLGYPENNAFGFDDVVFDWSEGRTLHAHQRLIPFRQVPTDSEETLTKWLYERWERKEDMLAHLYKNGTYPDHPDHRILRSDNVYLILCYLLYVVLAILLHKLLILPIWSVLSWCCF